MPATSASRMITIGSAPSPRIPGRFDVFILENESGCLDYFSVPNESTVLLHAGVSAELISRIHFELDEVAHELPVLSRQLRRFRRIAPRHLRARKIAELVGQPIKDNAFVVLRILAVDRRIADIFRRN